MEIEVKMACSWSRHQGKHWADRKAYLASSEGLLSLPRLLWYRSGEAVHCSRAQCLWKDQSMGCKTDSPGSWQEEGKLTAVDVVCVCTDRSSGHPLCSISLTLEDRSTLKSGQGSNGTLFVKVSRKHAI